MSGEKVGSVLFVCLARPSTAFQFATGNICRSPIAEAVFCNEVTRRGERDKWDIDSAGLGSWHVGSSPDSRAMACLAKHNVPTVHRARQVKKTDFERFDLILGMDHDNMQGLKQLQKSSSRAKLRLLGEFDPEKQLIVEDPYYGSQEDFEVVYEQCVRCCRSLLDQWSSVVAAK